jgi:reversibly glycosylated polypeptide/UDP-arabinopyranose mutase
MMRALVIPTVREACLRAFLDVWGPRRFWDQLIVVEGSERPTFEVPGATHVGLEDIDRDLGESAWVISRHDSARRSYGFLLAWRMGADVIYTLDDDCYPTAHDHAAEHERNLFATSRWESSIPGMRVRGLPYGNLGTLADVMLSVGLWRGVPDLDAPSSLTNGVPEDFVPPDGTRVLPSRQIVPVCGMNLAFRREFAPLAYFGLQGKPWPFGRFDDIWMGVVAQRICAHLGWSITLGRPHVHHRRASNAMRNLVTEAPGIAANETFWETINSVPLTADTPAGCMVQLGSDLAIADDPYLRRLGGAMTLWAGLFDG